MDLAKYMHGALFSPVKATLIQAIKNNHFVSWDELTTELISKHLQTSEATDLGHHKEERQGLQSTSNSRKNYKERVKDIRQRLQGILKTKTKDDSLQTTLNKDILLYFPRGVKLPPPRAAHTHSCPKKLFRIITKDSSSSTWPRPSNNT